MSFDDLKRKFREFFHNETKNFKIDLQRKILLKNVILAEFQKSFRNVWLLKILRLLDYRFSIGVSSSLVLVLGFTFFQLFGSANAGEIIPQAGLVEVSRRGENIVVKNKEKLRVGDIVKVANNAEAEIIFLKNNKSFLGKNTELEILAKNKVFVKQGDVQTEISSVGSPWLFNSDFEISSDRGVIWPEKNAKFNVSVSSSGETKIVSHNSSLEVMDFEQEGKTELFNGEELWLRTDTKLLSRKIPEDLRLSNIQLEAIKSRLIISRSKLLSAVLNMFAGKRSKARDEVVSAAKTFKSIVQVLNSSRNLKIIKRKSLDLIRNEEVFAKLSKRTRDLNLWNQALAIQSLLQLIESRGSQFAFAVPKTESISFNKYLALEYISSLASKTQKKRIKILQNEYSKMFFREIAAAYPLLIDQISALNTEISKLPRKKISRNFLRDVSKHCSSIFVSLIEEKINNYFTEA